MPAISLKLDFKFDEQGYLRIIDLGDGLSAGIDGFSETMGATILSDWYEASGANASVTLLGELPKELMQPETLHLPIVSRPGIVDERLTHIDDLALREERLALSSGCHRNVAYQSYFWQKKGLQNTATAPLGLIATEMHKVLWYALMDMHLPLDARPTVLYWNNFQAPETFDLSLLRTSEKGLFIKIGDRSTGGADEVYYVKNEREAQRVLQKLHRIYSSTGEKHIFIIEPAYVTMKGAYNATGRAFVTLHLDEETRALHVKIAGAKWITPEARFTTSNTEREMLANAGHQREMIDLEPAELEQLSRCLVDVYGDAFRAGFEHDDLMTYCERHPTIPAFRACLRKDAAYGLLLSTLGQDTGDIEASRNLMTSLLFSCMLRDSLPNLDQLLLIEYDSMDISLFARSNGTATKAQQMQTLINCICNLSLFERYVAFLITYENGAYAQHRLFSGVVAKGRRIELKLNASIVSYLKSKDGVYDTKDLSRALRQACSVSDLAVIKLLVHTNRADINACSPKTKQTPLDFANQSSADAVTKAHALNILRCAGAKTAEELTLSLVDMPKLSSARL